MKTPKELRAERRKQYLRGYQLQWTKKRRAAWLKDKCCVHCGSTERLELDHIDPSTKVSHRIWSWGRARFEIEIAKCQPLCRGCHQKKTAKENAERQLGSPNLATQKISAEVVQAVYERAIRGESPRKLAWQFGVSHSWVIEVRDGKYRRADTSAPSGPEAA